MWKKVLSLLLVFAIIMAGILLFGTPDTEKTGEEFFSHIKSGEFDEAYQMLSDEFKQSASQEILLDFLQRNNLDDYASIDWKQTNRGDKFTRLTGTIVTARGEKVSVILRFVEDDDALLIHSISKIGKSRKVATKKETKAIETTREPVDDGSLPTPDLRESTRLTQETINNFAHAVNEKSMASIYGHIARQWRDQTTIKELDAIFQSFYHAKIDLTILEKMTPVFDRPVTLSPEGILRMTGHYQTAPNVVHFDNSYMLEDGIWRPVAINVSVK